MSNDNHVETKFDGNKALISDKQHPHFGAIAICMGVDNTAIGWGMKFKREDTSEEFYVFKGSQVKWINTEQK